MTKNLLLLATIALLTTGRALAQWPPYASPTTPDAQRNAYNALKHTLNPQQSANGGNAIAELDAGLDILQEAFGNFQNDLAAGRSANVALRDMCQVLRQGMQLWSQQLNKTCSQLQVG